MTDKKPNIARDSFGVAYTIKPNADGNLVFTLSWSHREFLKFLGSRGGETDFDWTKLTEHQRNHLRPMIDSLGLLSETPIIGRPRSVLLRLTDTGRNILTAILQNQG